jgi:hypothetical protein
MVNGWVCLVCCNGRSSVCPYLLFLSQMERTGQGRLEGGSDREELERERTGCRRRNWCVGVLCGLQVVVVGFLGGCGCGCGCVGVGLNVGVGVGVAVRVPDRTKVAG